ncbi:MAG: threonine synthase [Acidobacteriota bacterium]
MKYISTGGSGAGVSLEEALFAGVAPDGGLYLPERLVPLSARAIARLRGASFADVGSVILQHLLGDDLPSDVIARVAASALDFPAPVVAVGDRVWCLELFHGPTLSFKDVGGRVMAELMAHFLRDGERELTVLVATSGDTGGAIAHAFGNRPGVRVVVLFPRGRVSARQQQQFTTLGKTVQAVAVGGSFDDCQRLARQALADADLRQHCRLASANSINLGRLLPQIVYYFHGVAQLPVSSAPLVIATPSGNFGNLTAGLMARRLGLPVSRFVAATNINDVVPAYLQSGRFEPRASVATIASAMDVGHPSNFARLMALYRHDLLALQEDLLGSAHTDGAARQTIRDLHTASGAVIDPHSAIGYLGVQAGLAVAAPEARGLFLATAHPAKCAEVVEEETGEPVPVPERLAACLDREEVVTDLPAEAQALRALLMA